MDIFFFFLIGAIVGSFLNVCIVRMPQDKSVVTPSSHCPKCNNAIAWYDNLPLVSWLILLGRCRHCKAKISLRYCLVELLTGCLFVIYYLYFGFSPLLPAYFVMLACFVVATFVDLAHRIIPDQISIGGMFAGIVLSAFIPSMHIPHEDLNVGAFLAGLIVLLCLILGWIYPIFCKHLMEDDPTYDDKPLKLLVLGSLIFVYLANGQFRLWPTGLNPYAQGLAGALIGYIIGGGAIYAMGMLGDIIFRKESMGGGDVKLMALIGAFLGWKIALLAFFIAPFFGAIIGIIEKIRTKDNTIAYGPFLIIGALVAQFWGNKIIDWIIQGGIYHL